MDERILDLLSQWEEETAKGTPTDLESLADGDSALAADLRRYAAALKKFSWLELPPLPVDEMRLPSSYSLRSALLTPNDLDLEKLQTDLLKSQLVGATELEKLLQTHRVKSANQLAGLLLENDLLTSYQLRAVAHGKTAGLKLGRYVILDKIGEGGMGQVYQARHSKMGRLVALKILPQEATAQPYAIDRFNQEVEVAAQLRHPNIVIAYDADEAQGIHYFVMEYVPGCDLSTLVKRDGVFSPLKAVDCLTQAAQGLEYAHQVGLVHRDIKPANLLLTEEGVVKILDMGIARLETGSDQTGLTQNGAVMGTVDFMAPEQAIDAKTVTGAADLYSLGCTLYYLLAGAPPFSGETLMAKLLGHREQSPPRLQEIRPDVPPKLEAIYQKCLAKLPADRYPSATELLADFEEVRPALSDQRPQMSIAASGVALDTSPTSLIETQPHVSTPSAGAPPARPQTAGQGRGRLIGGLIAAALLACGLCYYAAGMMFKIWTPQGSLVVEIEGDDFEAHLRDRQLTLINLKTQERTSIRLHDPAQTASLPPGSYKFSLETSGGLKTDVDQLTIASGRASKVRVHWEPPAAPSSAKSPADAPPTVASSPATPPEVVNTTISQPFALKFDGVDDYVQLPFGYRGEHPLTIEMVLKSPEPQAASSVIGTTEFSGVGFGFFQPEPSDPREARLSVSPTAKKPYEKVTSTDLPEIGRTMNVTTVLDSERIRLFIDGKQVAEKWMPETDRKYNDIPFVLGGSPNKSEHEESAIDYPFRGTVQQLRISDSARYAADFTPAYQWKPDAHTIALYRFDEGSGDLLKDVSGNQRHGKIVGDPQWVALRPESLSIVRRSQTPSDSAQIDRRAAEYVLSVGGKIKINDYAHSPRPYIQRIDQLPADPFELTQVDLRDNQKLTPAALAVFQGTKNLRSLQLGSAANLTPEAISHFRENRALASLDLSKTGLPISALQPFQNAVALRDLRLNSNPIKADQLEYLRQFAPTRHLKRLMLSFVRIGDQQIDCFADASELEVLHLAGSALTDDGLKQIGNFSKLTQLHVKNTLVTAAGVARLRETLPNCKVICDDPLPADLSELLFADQADWQTMTPNLDQPLDWETEGKNFRYEKRKFTLKDSQICYPLEAEDIVVKANLSNVAAQNLALGLRNSKAGSYVGFFGGKNFFGIGKHIPNRGYVDLATRTTGENYADGVELTFAAVGDQLQLFANGKLVVAARDSDYKTGRVCIGVFRGSGQFAQLAYRHISDSSAAAPQQTAAQALTSTDYVWTQPEPVEIPQIADKAWVVYASLLEPTDQLYYSVRSDKDSYYDMAYSNRADDGQSWLAPQYLSGPISSPLTEYEPRFFADGTGIIFASTREGGLGRTDLWMARRDSLDEPFDEPVNLGAHINTPRYDAHPAVSEDGLTLVFESCYEDENRNGGMLYMATRQSLDEPFGDPVKLGNGINEGISNTCPAISPDGTALIFTSDRRQRQKPELWISTRATVDQPFGPPKLFGPAWDAKSWIIPTCISKDHSQIYLTLGTSDDEIRRLWVIRRIPAPNQSP
ncbi:MAG: protein kinase [Blastopirellula sp. JB062]